jgi:hypothetical protein
MGGREGGEAGGAGVGGTAPWPRVRRRTAVRRRRRLGFRNSPEGDGNKYVYCLIDTERLHEFI